MIHQRATTKNGTHEEAEMDLAERTQPVTTERPSTDPAGAHRQLRELMELIRNADEPHRVEAQRHRLVLMLDEHYFDVRRNLSGSSIRIEASMDQLTASLSEVQVGNIDKALDQLERHISTCPLTVT